MDADTYRQNCIQKAIQENLRFGTDKDHGNTWYCYNPKSDSMYKLVFNPRKGWECECESSKHRGYCKHIAGIIRWMTNKGMELPRIVPQTYILGGKPIGT
jgi:hypothetical protein